MKKIELKFLKNWEITREKGRLRFMLKAGTIWAICLTIIMTIFQHYAFDFELNAYLVFGNLFLYLLVGYLMHYYALWIINEARFQKIKAKHSLDKQYSQ